MTVLRGSTDERKGETIAYFTLWLSGMTVLRGSSDERKGETSLLHTVAVWYDCVEREH